VEQQQADPLAVDKEKERSLNVERDQTERDVAKNTSDAQNKSVEDRQDKSDQKATDRQQSMNTQHNPDAEGKKTQDIAKVGPANTDTDEVGTNTEDNVDDGN
jgi:hypothetical protein